MIFKTAASWLVGGKGHHAAVEEDPEAGLEQLREALQAMAFLMNDDISGAESVVTNGDSSYHKLGKSIIAFLRASLGFERDAIKDALEKATIAEASAERDRQRAIRDGHKRSSYPPGTEFALCAAESALMGAAVGFLSESVVETMKGVAKLRRAYLALAEIEKAEGGHSHAHHVEVRKSLERTSIELGLEKVRSRSETNLVAQPSGYNEKEPSNSLPSSRPASVRSMQLSKPGDETYELDIFIHSGYNLFFGILQIMLSFIPPSLSRILYLIGFYGDRSKGLKMLWRASKADNMHGAIATLALLQFYGGALQMCDIIPADNEEGRKKCHELLLNMRKKYPGSSLWHLEEARMMAVERNLDGAVAQLNVPLTTQMRQVGALIVFEKALNLLFLHRYKEAAEAFMKVKELNTWSVVIYHYFAGVAHVEAYRAATDPEVRAYHAKLAEELLIKAPTFMGKKQFLGGSLPLEIFADRKIKKWTAAAKAHGAKTSLIDAVGVSPVTEVIYFWNGFKRMPEDLLTTTIKTLDYERPATSPPLPADEIAVTQLLRAVLTRYKGDLASAREQLNKLLQTPPKTLKGHLKDDWVLPSAHYELAVVSWLEGREGNKDEVRASLKKAAGWESYELENRLGMRVVAGLETVGPA